MIGPDEIVCGPVEGVARNRMVVVVGKRERASESAEGEAAMGRRRDEDALRELANRDIGLDIVVVREEVYG